MKDLKNSSSPKPFHELVMGYSLFKFNRKLLSVPNKPSLEHRIALGLEFVELQYTTKYGFLTMVCDQADMCMSQISIPNIFDTVVIADVLYDSGITLNPLISRSITENLDNLKYSEGLWNFFYRNFNFIPDDIDTSSNVIALTSCLPGYQAIETVKAVKKLQELVILDDNNIPDIYIKYQVLPNAETPPVAAFPARRRIDLGVVANFLYCLLRTGVETLPKYENCYIFLDKALTYMIYGNGKERFLLKYAKNYENLDIIAYFISRLVSLSTHARALFQDKLIQILKQKSVSYKKHVDCLSAGFRILTAKNVDILEDWAGYDIVSRDFNLLMDMQSLESFAFPIGSLYNAHNKYYFGSSALTTAVAIAAIAAVKDSKAIQQNN